MAGAARHILSPSHSLQVMSPVFQSAAKNPLHTAINRIVVPGIAMNLSQYEWQYL